MNSQEILEIAIDLRGTAALGCPAERSSAALYHPLPLCFGTAGRALLGWADEGVRPYVVTPGSSR